MLWIVDGVFVIISCLGLFSRPLESSFRSSSSVWDIELTFLTVAMFVGLVLIISAIIMRSGSRGARVLATALGVLSFLFFWTIPLGVPALVLQFRSENKEWFQGRSPRGVR